MIYLDTSILIPLVIVEPSSDSIEALVQKIRPGDLTTSTWTQIEMASAIARKLRMGEFSASDASAVRLKFAQVLKEYFLILLPTSADYSLAAQYLEIPKTGLRAGDAFHLAIAANHHAKKILTLDKIFIKVGKQLKLPVSAGIY